MFKFRILVVLLSLLVLDSCNISKVGESDVDNVPEISDSLNIDTLAIQQKIMDSYREPYSYFDDSLKIQINDFFYPGQIVCSLNLNGDEWNDYFVIVDYMGGPVTGDFFDGKTGNRFEIEPSHVGILTRPGVDLEYTIVDIDCNDNQQELLVRTGGGGTIGNYYDCEIYRFDKASNKLKLIFEETITAFEWEEDGEKELEVNHVDINYTEAPCSDEILVREGIVNKPNDVYSLDITPKQNGTFWRYRFNPAKNDFELLETSSTK